MKVENFVRIIGADFYTGVPDSQLKALCDYLLHIYGIDSRHHIIAANEGNCTALAAGYHLSTGKIPVVYLQNSGEGNIINPVASLLNEKVYGIPMLFVIGWRGEPNVHDEPQHVFQGGVTCKLLEDMNIDYAVLDRDTSEDEVKTVMERFRALYMQGKQTAFVVSKGGLVFDENVIYQNKYTMSREEAIRHIVKVGGRDPIICTTGKASRELFELRTANGQGHEGDFLTVGSMGHASSIALGVALNSPDKRVWCIDGDGAVLMHMGMLAVIADCCPKNLIHVVINNGAHETVGGQPTVMRNLDIAKIAKACGYPFCVTVEDTESLDREMTEAVGRPNLSLIEVKCGLGARTDLGRPTTTTFENKRNFMEYLNREI